MMGIGVYTQYQPEQPIAFSHELHSGINGVDCNYCHSSARHSKHSGIPSANVCMNCHTYINEGTDEEGTKEIAKIYEAVGFDPDSRTYIEGYTQNLLNGLEFTIYQTTLILIILSMLLLGKSSAKNVMVQYRKWKRYTSTVN